MAENVRISVAQLCGALRSVQHAAAPEFSGIGVVVCDVPERLPMIPLSDSGDAEIREASLVKQLTAISSWQSRDHDGFHVISSDLRLLKIAQYFSPPIVPNVEVDRSRRIGGRYMAALFGSAMPGVIMCGIASDGFGIAIFRDGKEVMFEGAK